ncbi:MAG TPA: DUF3426 domain-containing protein [Gammaproteobacteria bacterium]|nr:DUF3426 domain-containing protein [Gammaproteobacteria bacterium]
MFTQCPRCDAIFQLSASQLRAANGDVRCGQCLSVFNALDHLSEELPQTADPAYTGNEHHDWSEKTPHSEPDTTDEFVTWQTDAEADDSIDIFSDIINEANSHDVPMEEIDRFEEFLTTSALPAEDTSTANDVLPAESSPLTDSALVTEESPLTALTDTDLADTFSANTDKVPVSTGETNFGDIDTATAALDTDILINDDEFAEFAVYMDKPDDKPRHTGKTDTDDDPLMIETADPDPDTSTATDTGTPDAIAEQQPDTGTVYAAAPENDWPAETAHKPEEQPTSAHETQDINIPSLILDDLHAAKAEQLRPSSTPWIIGSLLLMFTLVSQVIYHSRDELAKDAALRPWLIQMCAVLNCTLSQPYDIKQIEIIGRDVRSHPSADNALIVSTTLINTATFAQPFPLLTMVFSDINGKKIAQRRFTPREYLSNTVDLNTGMTPDMPIRIDLELVDPGKAAVNYEFHAEIDPRQTRPLT